MIRRVLAIASAAFADAIRHRVVYVVGVFAIVMAMAHKQSAKHTGDAVQHTVNTIARRFGRTRSSMYRSWVTMTSAPGRSLSGSRSNPAIVCFLSMCFI